MPGGGQVPRFGNWEGEATIPYTVCFDRAVGGHAKGDMITPSSHNPEKQCDDSKDVEEKLTEEPSWEVPKFGEWEDQADGADGVQYTVYFDKVRKRGSRGRTNHENDLHKAKFAENAQPVRKSPIREKSPQHQKDKKASSEGHKKMPAKQSSDSKHSADGLAAPIQHHKFSEMKTSSHGTGESRLRENAHQNKKSNLKEVPATVTRSSGSWEESNPSQISSRYTNDELQSAANSNSPYHKSPTKIKPPNASTCCFPWGRK